MRRSPLQTTHGFGVRPVRVAAHELADDPGAKRLLEIERQMRDSHARAPARGRRPRPRESSSSRAPSLCRSAHSFRVTATTSTPRSRSSSAATAESTPPLMATSTRSPPGRRVRERHARRGRGRRAPGGARRRPGPPRGGPAERARRGPRADLLRRRSRAAASTSSPSTSSATAAAAALAAAQPSASKRDRVDRRRPSITSERRTRSPHGAPPAAPLKAPSGAGPRRESSLQVVARRARSSCVHASEVSVRPTAYRARSRAYFG